MDPFAVSSSVGATLLLEVEEVSLEEVLTEARQAVQRRRQQLQLPRCPKRTQDHSPYPGRHAQPASTVPGLRAQLPQPVPPHSRTIRPKQTLIPALDELIHRHFLDTGSPQLDLAGRSMPLVYHLLATLLPRRQTILIIDPECRFVAHRAASFLAAQQQQQQRQQPQKDRPKDGNPLDHVYVVRPPPAQNLQECIDRARHWMVYGQHQSLHREWWGTMVLGGGGASRSGGDVYTGGRKWGWLRVDRYTERQAATEVNRKPADNNNNRNNDLEIPSLSSPKARWIAHSQWGRYIF